MSALRCQNRVVAVALHVWGIGASAGGASTVTPPASTTNYVAADASLSGKTFSAFADADGNLFPDNDERAIFFAKGVVETVKKLNWSPDIIHVHDWLASLLPLYLRKYYADEPIFADSKIVTSVYGQGFEGELDSAIVDKIAFDGIPTEDIKALEKPDYNNLLKIAVDHSDAIILASEQIPDELDKHISNLSKPVLPYVSFKETEEAYANFYNSEVLK
mgnify:CR=1 FL=1